MFLENPWGPLRRLFQNGVSNLPLPRLHRPSLQLPSRPGLDSGAFAFMSIASPFVSLLLVHQTLTFQSGLILMLLHPSFWYTLDFSKSYLPENVSDHTVQLAHVGSLLFQATICHRCLTSEILEEKRVLRIVASDCPLKLGCISVGCPDLPQGYHCRVHICGLKY